MVTKSPELADMWRDAMREWEKQTNAALNRAAGTEEFSQAMNQNMSAMLRLQTAYSDGVEQTLAKLNLPNRGDFRTIMSKLDDIEQRLDRMAAQLDRLSEGRPSAAEPLVRPRRTRRAPSAGGSS